jgi:hypothetical protein
MIDTDKCGLTVEGFVHAVEFPHVTARDGDDDRAPLATQKSANFVRDTAHTTADGRCNCDVCCHSE